MERNTEKSNEKRRVGVRGLNSKGLETGQRRHIVLSLLCDDYLFG